MSTNRCGQSSPRFNAKSDSDENLAKRPPSTVALSREQSVAAARQFPFALY
jgi:hypothetical protein